MRDFVVITIVLAMLVGVGVPVAPVAAEVKTWVWVAPDPPSWHRRGNWSPPGRPRAGDRAIIANNTRCEIDNTRDAECRRIKINGSGSIVELLSGAVLTLGDGNARTSKILDWGRLELGNATLKINGDHTIIGDFGEIELQSAGARIVETEGEGEHVLTLEGIVCPTREAPVCPLVLHGTGDIEVTLVNTAYVKADRQSSYLNLTTNDKSGDGYWIAEEGGILALKAIMVTGAATWQAVDRDYGGKILLSAYASVMGTGKVYVTGEGVGLEVQSLGTFCTTGNLEFKSVPTESGSTTPAITVEGGGGAGFGVKSCWSFP